MPGILQGTDRNFQTVRRAPAGGLTGDTARVVLAGPAHLLSDAAHELGDGERALFAVLSAGYPHTVLQRHDVLLERSGATRRDLHRLLTTAGFRDLAELQARVTDKLNGELRSPARPVPGAAQPGRPRRNAAAG